MLQKIEKLIKSRSVAFIGSVGDDGFPNIKAMLSPRIYEGVKTLYFSTNTSSSRVHQYRQNPKACVYFFRKGLIRYWGVMLKGEMQVLEDEETKKKLWRAGDRIFYPKGVTDPDYCVLKFTAFEGNYYCDLKNENFTV
jgi:general stress protein 26